MNDDLTNASMHLLMGIAVPSDRVVERVAPSVRDLQAIEVEAAERLLVSLRARYRRLRGYPLSGRTNDDVLELLGDPDWYDR